MTVLAEKLGDDVVDHGAPKDVAVVDGVVVTEDPLRLGAKFCVEVAAEAVAEVMDGLRELIVRGLAVGGVASDSRGSAHFDVSDWGELKKSGIVKIEGAVVPGTEGQPFHTVFLEIFRALREKIEGLYVVNGGQKTRVDL